MNLRRLLDFVARLYASGQDYIEIDEWFINRVSQRTNGLLYRIQYTGSNPNIALYGDLAVKMSKHDARDRAGREYAATSALHELGLNISPKPLHLDYEPPGLPGIAVFTATWLAGKPLPDPPIPQDKRSWRDILYALCDAHKVTPQKTDVQIGDAFMPVREPADLLTILQARRAKLPDGDVGALTGGHLDYMLNILRESIPLRWEHPATIGLILGDPSPGNMLSHNSTIRLVDWEDSGWADPAFEIGDLCAQPLYFDLPAEHTEWLRIEHGRILGDRTLADRAGIYEIMMNVYWLINMSSGLVHGHLDRLETGEKVTDAYCGEMQLRYWERCCAMLGLEV